MGRLSAWGWPGVSGPSRRWPKNCPLGANLKDAGNRFVFILGASLASDLAWEEAIRGDIDLVVAVGPSEEVERLDGVVDLNILLTHITSGLSDTVIATTPGMELAPAGKFTVVGTMTL